MTNNTDYKKWKELFRKEQKGTNPEERMYQPFADIAILPYLDKKETTYPSFAHGDDKIAHSFIIEELSAMWISDYSVNLEPYHIDTVYGDLNVMTEKKELNSLRSINPQNFYGSLPGDDDATVILDLRSKDNLPKIKESINNPQDEFLRFWIIPGDDFLWNVAFIRGMKKYYKNARHRNFYLSKLSIYLPLKELNHVENEGQLIPLSSQLLSMLVSGLTRCIWDLREASEWQQRNLLSILNVPEIMDREGKVLIEKDPIQGSDFFEELSDKLCNFLLA